MCPPFALAKGVTAPEEVDMSGNATIVMVLIGSFVWGGFLLIPFTAIRKERHKTAAFGALPPRGRGIDAPGGGVERDAS